MINKATSRSAKDKFKANYEAFLIRVCIWILHGRNVARAMVVSRQDNNMMYAMAEQLEAVERRIKTRYAIELVFKPYTPKQIPMPRAPVFPDTSAEYRLLIGAIQSGDFIVDEPIHALTPPKRIKELFLQFQLQLDTERMAYEQSERDAIAADRMANQ